AEAGQHADRGAQQRPEQYIEQVDRGQHLAESGQQREQLVHDQNHPQTPAGRDSPSRPTKISWITEERAKPASTFTPYRLPPSPVATPANSSPAAMIQPAVSSSSTNSTRVPTTIATERQLLPGPGSSGRRRMLITSSSATTTQPPAVSSGNAVGPNSPASSATAIRNTPTIRNAATPSSTAGMSSALRPDQNPPRQGSSVLRASARDPVSV